MGQWSAGVLKWINVQSGLGPFKSCKCHVKWHVVRGLQVVEIKGQ